MGVKAIAAWLNERSIRTRDGGRWGLGAVHQILTRSTYTGRHEFNRRGKDRKLKPKSEAVVVDVPPIINQGTYDAAQAHLQARKPQEGATSRRKRPHAAYRANPLREVRRRYDDPHR